MQSLIMDTEAVYRLCCEGGIELIRSKNTSKTTHSTSYPAPAQLSRPGGDVHISTTLAAQTYPDFRGPVAGP